jgi:hypothetical protein
MAMVWWRAGDGDFNRRSSQLLIRLAIDANRCQISAVDSSGMRGVIGLLLANRRGGMFERRKCHWRRGCD